MTISEREKMAKSMLRQGVPPKAVRAKTGLDLTWLQVQAAKYGTGGG